MAEHRQMIPLDPPFSEGATIGGIVAAKRAALDDGYTEPHATW